MSRQTSREVGETHAGSCTRLPLGRAVHGGVQRLSHADGGIGCHAVTHSAALASGRSRQEAALVNCRCFRTARASGSSCTLGIASAFRAASLLVFANSVTARLDAAVRMKSARAPLDRPGPSASLSVATPRAKIGRPGAERGQVLGQKQRQVPRLSAFRNFRETRGGGWATLQPNTSICTFADARPCDSILGTPAAASAAAQGGCRGLRELHEPGRPQAALRRERQTRGACLRHARIRRQDKPLRARSVSRSGRSAGGFCVVLTRRWEPRMQASAFADRRSWIRPSSA